LTNLLGDDPTYLQFIEEDTVFKWILDLEEFSALRDEAESDMEELSSPDADEKDILGQTLAADGRLDEAIRAFRSAILIQPTQPEFDFNLANAFVADGRLPQAKEEYLEALKQKSLYGEAYCRLASIYQTYPSD
jgi:tetratricopeptide (TPR) repeat protein